MTHLRLNFPRPKTLPDGTIDPESLRRLMRVLNDWSRNLDAHADEIEAKFDAHVADFDAVEVRVDNLESTDIAHAARLTALESFAAGVGWGGIGTT